MFIWVVILVSMLIIYYFWSNKIYFRFDTIFRKGFQRTIDKYGIYTFVGKMGDGKTYSCVDWLTEEIKISGKKVITNVYSYYINHKENTLYFTDFYEIIKFLNEETKKNNDKNYVIFFDELFTLLEKGKLDKSILGFISQLRKRGIFLVTTVQEWLDINVTFRRYCRYFVECKMYDIFGCTWSVNKIHNGYEMHWNNDINEYESPIISTTIKKCSKAIANSYDTYEVIGANKSA